jgi:curved DNA-binding protein CbpA
MIASGMNGQLSEHPFAELISEISTKGLSGALRVARDRVKGAVYFESGELIYATTNLRGHRLLKYVGKRVPVSTQTIAAIKGSSSDFAIAEKLLASGMLRQETLDKIFAEQVADVIRMLLLWTLGEWSFDNRARLTESIRASVPTRQLLIEAARRLDLKFAAERFPNPHELIFRGENSLSGLSLLPAEGFLLSRVERPSEMGELTVLSGLREPDAQRTIYGLVLAGLLKREYWPHAFRSAQPQKPGKVAAGKPPAATTRDTSASAQPVSDPQQELSEFLERLAQATDYYEVLNVPVSASAAEIKHAYHGLARRFHPDRYHEIARSELHARLESAFARITQAHETLLDPDLRTTYDLKIAVLKRVSKSLSAWPKTKSEEPAGGKTDASDTAGDDPQTAERRFKEGVAALQLGETNAAISSLSAAARLRPHQPEFRAYLGHAFARHEKTRRLAEAELLAAVKLDPANATYHVMLAALYRDLGFSRRAFGELERALSLDSQNAEAREMMRKLELNK